MKKVTLILISIFLLMTTISKTVHCEEVTVATLRDFKPILEEIKKEFEKKNPSITINFIEDNENEIVKNLQLQESPIDVIFLDNAKLIKELGETGVINKSTINHLGKDQLCMIVKKSTPMRAYMLYPRTFVMNAVVISNPYKTALGNYTKEALTNLGLYKKASKKLVFFDSNINVIKKVTSGEFDGGISYCSFAKRSFVKITDKLNPDIYSKIIYTSGVNATIKEPSAAHKFNNYLKSSEGKAILKKFNLTY